MNMKKNLLSLLLLFPFCSFAQKGMQGIGVSLGYGIETAYLDKSGVNQAANLNVIFQNFVTDYLRFSTSFGIVVNEHSYIEDPGNHRLYKGQYYCGGMDIHLFGGIRRLRPYVIGGFSIGNFQGASSHNYDDLWIHRGHFAFGTKLGIGLNYRLGYHLTTQIEVPIYGQGYNYYWGTNMYLYLIPSINIVYTF